MRMSMEARGVYITLMSLAWIDGSLPNNERELSLYVNLTHKKFISVWESLKDSFVERDGRLIQPRLEIEREKQREYRKQQSTKGLASWLSRQSANHGSTEPQPHSNQTYGAGSRSVRTESKSSSSSSSSTAVQIRDSAAYLYQSPTPAAQALPAYVGKQRPIPGYRRLRIFRWMLDDILAMLGDHAEAFDLDAWLLTLDASPGLLPVELWPWLKEQVLEQAALRGYGAAETGPKKKTPMQLAIEKIQAELD